MKRDPELRDQAAFSEFSLKIELILGSIISRAPDNYYSGVAFIILRVEWTLNMIEERVDASLKSTEDNFIEKIPRGSLGFFKHDNQVTCDCRNI